MNYQDPPTPDSKLCPECNLIKPLDDFYYVGRERKRRRSYCKKCHAIKFKNTNIFCPHCGGKILCVGVNKFDKPTRHKNSLTAKLRRDLKEKKKRNELVKADPSVKDLLNDD